MCVIAYKAKAVRLPSGERIREMWEANPDGAGVMWRDEGTDRIRFVKGFMQLNDLNRWIEKNGRWLDDVECALHFRFATHGGKSRGNCHPFVCDGKGPVRRLRGKAAFVMMHNGILPIVPRREDISDSAELALRIGRCECPTEAMDAVAEMFRGNRIIVMGPGATKFYGDCFVKVGDDGILYSNSCFAHPTVVDSIFDHQAGGGGCGSSSFPQRWCGWRQADAFTRCCDDGRGMAIAYDYGVGRFVDALSGETIPLGRVDPDSLSREDYEVYLALMDEYACGEAWAGCDPEAAEASHRCRAGAEDVHEQV